ncbi:MAG TPA: nuclear transport factor 2 family protein [Thermoanaerobaculia bacterium]|nr:nuclear transport factor 2 family protein [Thermoanaerobaculia bacterium]
MIDEKKELAIREAMRDLARAFLERDVAVLNEALDDDFTGFDPGGVVVSKARWLADVESGELVFQRINSDEIEFLEGGDDSVRVRGQLTFTARYTRSNYNGSFRYLGVYAKRGDKWKLVLSTARRVAPGT